MTFNPLIEKKPSQKGKIYLKKSSYVVCGCCFFLYFNNLQWGKRLLPCILATIYDKSGVKYCIWIIWKKAFSIQWLFGKHIYKEGYCFVTICICFIEVSLNYTAKVFKSVQIFSNHCKSFYFSEVNYLFLTLWRI